MFLQRIGLNMLDDLMELGGPKAQNFVPSFMPHMLRLSLSQDMDLRCVCVFFSVSVLRPLSLPLQGILNAL